MRYETMFRFLLVAHSADLGVTGRHHLAGIVSAIESRGTCVTIADTLLDARLAVENDAAIGCMLLEWGGADRMADIKEFVAFVRHRGLDTPLFLLVSHHHLQEIDADTLKLITGYVFAGEDTPEFLAKNLLSHLSQYAESLKTPFFGAMIDYAEQGNQMWTCPGHNGGVFYRKSPVGQLFVEHLGEAVFRNDLDNSVVELGDLLTHEGPARQAEIEAAKIFGAERTYFVLNGTSTSNKIALSAIVAPGDLVLFDRNNHKAAVHGALLFGGGIPVYLETTRNPQGLIGPIDADALEEKAIREKIRTHPLVTDPEAWRRPRPFRAAVIEQCTYDGTIYSAEQILAKLGPLCDYLFFDEAWAGFMKFHPLFRGRFAMGLGDLGPEAPGIIATQSTHKQLAGFSQASQIHVKDSHVGDRRRVEPRRFNELFMLHASTSPFYPLFASLDVGAQMMKGRSGIVLWDDTIRLGIELRKKIRALKTEYETQKSHHADAWFFDPFVPDFVPVENRSSEGMRWEDISTDRLASEPDLWTLAPQASWHGFRGLTPGYAMTDPNKLTLLTPGFDRATGQYLESGVPAPVVAEFLRERRIVPEKNDFNSILFLLTPGLESSKAGTLLSGLVAFKQAHEENAPLDDAIPSLVARYPGRYAGMGVRDLCQQLHEVYRKHDASRLQAAQFAGGLLPEIVMPPRDAWERLLRNQVDYVPISEVEGRIAATLALVYPPGIGVVVPGERYGGRARAALDYLLMFEQVSNRFPGFENEIQGVYRERAPDGSVRLFTYVLQNDIKEI
jgi:ornithine decarboxylase